MVGRFLSPSGLHRDKRLQVIFAVTALAVLGVYTVTPALNIIVEELGVAEARVGLLLTFYTLPGAALAPVMGVLADRYGRKRVLVPSLFIFAAAGAACFFARDFQTLLYFRVVQGLGAVALGPIAITLVGDLYPGGERAEAMGLNASIFYVSIALYPLVGGALADLSWNYPFLLSLAAVPVGFLVMRRLDDSHPRASGGLKDYIVGVARYVRTRRVSVAFAGGVAVFVLLYGVFLTFFSLYLGDSFGASSFMTGVVLSASFIATAVVSSQLGRLTRRFSLTALVKLGFALYAVALGLILVVPSVRLAAIPAVVLGVGHGIIVPSLLTYLAGMTPARYRAGFMSVNTLMTRLGQTLGPVIFAFVFARGGFGGVFFWGAVVAAVAAFAGLVGGGFIRK